MDRVVAREAVERVGSALYLLADLKEQINQANDLGCKIPTRATDYLSAIRRYLISELSMLKEEAR